MRARHVLDAEELAGLDQARALLLESLDRQAVEGGNRLEVGAEQLLRQRPTQREKTRELVDHRVANYQAVGSGLERRPRTGDQLLARHRRFGAGALLANVQGDRGGPPTCIGAAFEVYLVDTPETVEASRQSRGAAEHRRAQAN